MKKLLAMILTLCMLVGVLPAMAETAANTAAIDLDALCDHILEDIVTAVISVDMTEAQAKAKDADSYKGSVFGAMEKVFAKIIEVMEQDGKEESKDMKKVMELLSAAKEQGNVDEDEFDLVSAMMLVAITASVTDRTQAEDVDIAEKLTIVGKMVQAVYESAQENEVLTDAVKATDSKLFEMFAKANTFVMKYLEQAGNAPAENPEVDEKAFERFEDEALKLEEYIKSREGRKQSALDILNLLHDVIDEIHKAIDGHSHIDERHKTAAFETGAAFGMTMAEVIAAIGSAAYEIDTEHTHGPVTFTELEFENTSVDGKFADEHYMFVDDELVAIRICFEEGAVTFDQARQDLTAIYGEFTDLDLSKLGNGIYAVDDDGKLKGKAVSAVTDDFMVVIVEDGNEVEVTYIDVTAAFLLVI